MSRSAKEWVAKHDDQAIPPRVKIRIYMRCDGRCQKCTTRHMAGAIPQYDHIKALINGGEHRESNLQLLCVPCHTAKTKVDVAEKSVVATIQKKHLGIRKRSTFPCGRDSPFKKKIGGQVVRR